MSNHNSEVFSGNVPGMTEKRQDFSRNNLCPVEIRNGNLSNTSPNFDYF
jgi:hypothetical protein